MKVHEVQPNSSPKERTRSLYTDGLSNHEWSGARIVLISPENHRVHSALRFKFKALNNEVEYETLIIGLGLAYEMKAKILQIYNKS